MLACVFLLMLGDDCREFGRHSRGDQSRFKYDRMKRNSEVKPKHDILAAMYFQRECLVLAV